MKSTPLSQTHTNCKAEKSLEGVKTPARLHTPAGMSRATSRKLTPAHASVESSFLEQGGSGSKAYARNEHQWGTEFSTPTFSTPTRRSVFDQLGVSEGEGSPSKAIQGIHSAPLQANISRKAGNPGKPHSPLVVRERHSQDPCVHKRKPIPLFESPGSENSAPRYDIFSPRRHFERGSLNTPPSAPTPLKQGHLTEAPNPRVSEEAVFVSSAEARCNPVGPNESNTGAGSVMPETILGGNGPKGVQVGVTISTVEESVLGWRGMEPEAGEPGIVPLTHSDGRGFTKPAGAKNLFTRTKYSPRKLQTNRSQSSAHTTWPKSSLVAKVPGGSASRAPVMPGGEARISTLIKAEQIAHKGHGEQEKQSTWHSSIAFTRRPRNSSAGVETKQDNEQSATANYRTFLKKGSRKKNVATTMQIGPPHPGTFRHLNSNGVGSEPPMLTHALHNALNSTTLGNPSSAAEQERGKSRSYRGFAGFFSQSKGYDDKGKGKEVATSTKPPPSFLMRLKGTASSLGNTPESTQNDHTTPKVVKPPTPGPNLLQLNRCPSCSPGSLSPSLHYLSPPDSSPPYGLLHNNQFYQLQNSEINSVTNSWDFSAFPQEPEIDISSLDKNRGLTGSCSMPVIQVSYS